LIFATALLLTASVAQAPTVSEVLERADAFYARRAEGSSNGVARLEFVDRAIAEYRLAMSLDPSSYEARLGLLRAFWFRGGFCGMAEKDQIELFEEAKKLAEQTVKRLDVDVVRKKGKVRMDRAQQIDPAAETYLWAAVSWGQWAVSHSVSAAFQGAPARIRDLAKAVIQIDPSTEQGGGLAVLGRLHTECPRVVFITMWVSRQEGLRLLREARAIAPQNPANAFFLAAALLDQKQPQTAEARPLLEWTIQAVPRPEYLVEDAHYAAEARALLATLR
jgi:tetratricopeptide (TPR) repeat protein